MLLTVQEEAQQLEVVMPSPERLHKVKKSMAMIKVVLDERVSVFVVWYQSIVEYVFDNICIILKGAVEKTGLCSFSVDLEKVFKFWKFLMFRTFTIVSAQEARTYLANFAQATAP